MDIKLIKTLCKCRFLIGFLGEKQQFNWWGSSFLSSSSVAFLAPVFPNSIISAQYNGVCKAASIIHDELIGKGSHYHLYRLPDSIEKELLGCLQNKDEDFKLNECLADIDHVLRQLKETGLDDVDQNEGPVVVGDYSDKNLEKLVKCSISHYVLAFENDYKSFPYMRRS